MYANLPIMRIVRTFRDLEPYQGGVFVPTMGALHEGHLSLIRHAAEIGQNEDKPVVVSIFVNPMQFGPGEDYEKYPRDAEADLSLAKANGADVVFLPETDTIYPPGETIYSPPLPPVATEPGLEDASRPGHFTGVCQVVAQLFSFVRPRWAIFGEKDYQQLLVIRALVAQENNRWPGLDIISQLTIREPNGLALSSRNARLSEEQRPRAAGIYSALKSVAYADSPFHAEEVMRRILTEHGLTIDYAVVRNGYTLAPITNDPQPTRALIAARIGEVRLIDNLSILRPPT